MTQKPLPKKNSSPGATSKTTRRSTQRSSTALGTEDVLNLDEPLLQFAEGQFAVDPHDGLALYGPYSKGTPSHPVSPPYMIIGASEGIAAMQRWSEAMNCAHAAQETKTVSQMK